MSKILQPAQLKYLQSFRKQPDEILMDMESFASKKNIPILNWQSAEFLEQLILLKEPRRVLEIGTAIGYSTIRIARSLKKKSTIDTIEKSRDNIALAEEYITKAGLFDKVNIIEGDAIDVMPKLNKKYQFIFLDADKEDYKTMFNYSLILLKKGGVIVVDNLLWHGYAASVRVPASYKVSTSFIRDFNNIFCTHPNLKTTIIPVGDGLGIGIKI
ncbi:MAG: O-methyltransferase [Ignavibacteriaceae bacterium]